MPPTNNKDSDSMDNENNGTIIYQLTEQQLDGVVERAVRRAIAKIKKEQEAEAEPNPEQPPRFYTRQQCADMLKCSLPTIHKLINTGEIRATKVNRSTRIFADHFDQRFRAGQLAKYVRR